MKVSHVSIVSGIAQKLANLRNARDAVQYNTLTVNASKDEGMTTRLCGGLLSVAACRRAIGALLEHEIAETLEHLKTYGVDDDE